MAKADRWLSPTRHEIERLLESEDRERRAAKRVTVLTRRKGRIIKRVERCQ